MLRVRGVSKRYGGVTAISGLSFDLARGEVLGVIGPNGAGEECMRVFVGKAVLHWSNFQRPRTAAFQAGG